MLKNFKGESTKNLNNLNRASIGIWCRIVFIDFNTTAIFEKIVLIDLESSNFNQSQFLSSCRFLLPFLVSVETYFAKFIILSRKKIKWLFIIIKVYLILFEVRYTSVFFSKMPMTFFQLDSIVIFDIRYFIIRKLNNLFSLYLQRVGEHRDWPLSILTKKVLESHTVFCQHEITLYVLSFRKMLRYWVQLFGNREKASNFSNYHDYTARHQQNAKQYLWTNKTLSF